MVHCYCYCVVDEAVAFVISYKPEYVYLNLIYNRRVNSGDDGLFRSELVTVFIRAAVLIRAAKLLNKESGLKQPNLSGLETMACQVYQVKDCWVELATQKYQDPGGYGFNNLVKLDNERFAMQMRGYFLIYNVTQNKWNKLKAKYVANATLIAYNAITKQLYHSGLNSARYDPLKVMHIDNIIAGKDTFEAYDCDDQINGSEVIFVGDTLHIIGGCGSDDEAEDDEQTIFNSHYIWNEDNKSVQHIHTFDDIKGSFTSYGLVHASNRGELYILGGFDYGQATNKWRRDEIYKYNISDQKWTKLKNIKLPHKMNNFGCVITRNERYIICSAGLGDSDVDAPSYKDIFVLDLNLMKIFECDIGFPFNRICRAIIMDQYEEDELLIYGFVRYETIKYNIDIPVEIMKLLVSWYCIEYMHVINEEGRHWKIDIAHIINSIHHH